MPFSDEDRMDLAKLLGILRVSLEALEGGLSTQASEDMWIGLGADVQVGLLLEWTVARAAATCGTDAVIAQLMKEIELLRKDGGGR